MATRNVLRSGKSHQIGNLTNKWEIDLTLALEFQGSLENVPSLQVDRRTAANSERLITFWKLIRPVD
ncbi:MAG: hypothetical protein CMJ80_02490 [Planctomycetaceae bacterium]|nr:hypothetical protein [Planctomycetaceae bacterium]